MSTAAAQTVTAEGLLRTAEEALERLAEMEGVTEANGYAVLFDGRAMVTLFGDHGRLGPEHRTGFTDFNKHRDAAFAAYRSNDTPETETEA